MDKVKPLLEARNIKKCFLKPNTIEILSQIDLSVFPQESVAIIGRSGEGKSTLLQILGALEEPSSGELFCLGKHVRSSNKAEMRSRHIGFVFQSFHLLEDYNVLDNVLMPAKIARLPTHKASPAYQKGLELLDKVGLSKRAFFGTRQLSGGEKQRVAIARAMCNSPSVILADEPSGNLDRETASLIHSLLLDYAKEPGKALVIVTHDKELAKECSKQLVLEKGRLLHPF